MTEKDCILWPVRFLSTSYDLKITEGITESTKSITVVTGRNYFLSGDGQADSATNNGQADLVAMFETMLDGIYPGRFTVSISQDMEISITNTLNASWAMNWSDSSSTLDGSIFGFTGADVSTTTSTITAPNKAKGLWRSGTTRSEDSRDRQPVLGAVALTMSGIARTSNLLTPKKTRSLAWSFISQSKALAEYADATDTTEAFESAWLEAISKGYEFRLYENEDTRTASSYSLYRTENLLDPIAPSSAPVRYDIALSCVRAD